MQLASFGSSLAKCTGGIFPLLTSGGLFFSKFGSDYPNSASTRRRGKSGEAFLGLLLLLILWRAVGWPLWFIAHWLGVRWVIVVERDGKKVTELVRGWGKSQRRIQEIAESAAAGTLHQF